MKKAQVPLNFEKKQIFKEKVNSANTSYQVTNDTLRKKQKIIKWKS